MNTNRNSPFQAFDRSEIGSPNSERAGDNTTLAHRRHLRYGREPPPQRPRVIQPPGVGAALCRNAGAARARNEFSRSDSCPLVFIRGFLTASLRLALIRIAAGSAKILDARASVRPHSVVIIKPKVRGFVCVTAHPEGCAAHVEEQIRLCPHARPDRWHPAARPGRRRLDRLWPGVAYRPGLCRKRRHDRGLF